MSSTGTDKFAVTTRFSSHNARLHSKTERISAAALQTKRFREAAQKRREMARQAQAAQRRGTDKGFVFDAEEEARQNQKKKEEAQLLQEREAHRKAAYEGKAEAEEARAKQIARDKREAASAKIEADRLAEMARTHALLSDKHPLVNSAGQSIPWNASVNKPDTLSTEDAIAAVEQALTPATFTGVAQAVQTLADYVRATHGILNSHLIGYTYPTLAMLHVICNVVARFGDHCLSIGSGMAITEALAERYARDILGHSIQITATEPYGMSYFTYFSSASKAPYIAPFAAEALDVVAAFAKYGSDNNVVFLAWPPTGDAVKPIAHCIRAWANNKTVAGVPCAVIMVHEHCTGGKALDKLFDSSWQELIEVPSIRHLFTTHTTVKEIERISDYMSVYVPDDDVRSKVLGAEAVDVAVKSFRPDGTVDLLANGRMTHRAQEEIAYSHDASALNFPYRVY